MARRARDRAMRRQRREVEASEQIPCPARPFTESPSVEEFVQDEIARLPDPFRGPVILCCLEGLSLRSGGAPTGPHRTDPARPAPSGSQAARITVTRPRNHDERDSRSAVEPVRLVLPPLSSSLVESTVQFSIRWSSVTGLLSGAAVIPESITGLAQGVIKTMLLQSLKLSGIVTLLAAGVAGDGRCGPARKERRGRWRASNDTESRCQGRGLAGLARSWSERYQKSWRVRYRKN